MGVAATATPPPPLPLLFVAKEEVVTATGGGRRVDPPTRICGTEANCVAAVAALTPLTPNPIEGEDTFGPPPLATAKLLPLPAVVLV